MNEKNNKIIDFILIMVFKHLILRANEAVCGKIFFCIRKKNQPYTFKKEFTVEISLPFAIDRMMEFDRF